MNHQFEWKIEKKDYENRTKKIKSPNNSEYETEIIKLEVKIKKIQNTQIKAYKIALNKYFY